jgi:hypothetical protein
MLATIQFRVFFFSSHLLSRNGKIKIYKTVTLTVDLYGCETWSLTLREEHRLMVFENRVLRRIFGQKRDEVTGEWRKLNKEELQFVLIPRYYEADQVKENEVSGTCGMHGRGEESVQGLMGKPEGKSPLGRRRHRWKDGIRVDLRKIGWGSVEWTQLAQDRDWWWALVNMVMNLRVLVPWS